MSKEYKRITVRPEVRDAIRNRKAIESAKRNTNLSYSDYLSEKLDLEVEE